MKDIYVEMLKEWGGFKVGDIVRFGQPKGERIIDMGIGRKVKKQKEVNAPEPIPVPKAEPPKVETATAELKTEKAVVAPEIKPKEEIKEENKETKI